MSLDTVLENFQRNVPGCIAAGVVDLDAPGRDPRAYSDLSAATAGALFRGEDVVVIEQMFGRMRGLQSDGRRPIQEIVIFSENLLHLFQRCRRNPNMILTTTCFKEASLGVVMVKSRDMLDVVDLAL